MVVEMFQGFCQACRDNGTWLEGTVVQVIEHLDMCREMGCLLRNHGGTTCWSFFSKHYCILILLYIVNNML